MCLEFELKWIDENLDKYDSALHANAVKQNIRSRYLINELSEALQELLQVSGINGTWADKAVAVIEKSKGESK